MVQILGVIAVVALVTTLASTIIAIWMEEARADHFLQLTDSLLSWEVIAAGLAIGVGRAFYAEIKAIMTRLAR